MPNGRFTLVGAGPGDPDLITVKGLNAIKEADIILYDALANNVLLEHARPNCEKIFVGKKPGIHNTQQVDINAMIVELAQKGNHIVRLKGGDPYIFGRGHEEEQTAIKHGIPVEVIPGVSSFYSVPEINGLPLTRRDYSESFWVLTGTNKSLEMAQDIQLAAESNATVVVLMGMSKLSQICDIFRSKGKEEVPVAIIQNGSLPNEKRVVGTITTIVDLCAKHDVSSPAIIVIGRVGEILIDYPTANEFIS